MDTDYVGAREDVELSNLSWEVSLSLRPVRLLVLLVLIRGLKLRVLERVVRTRVGSVP